MRYTKKKSKLSKIVALLLIVCVIITLKISTTDKSKTGNITTTEYHASITDSSYSVVDEGFNFTMVGQGSQLNCYAFSSTKAMEARLFKLGYGIVNFSEQHMTNFVDNLGRPYDGAITYDDVWLEYLEPKDENGSALYGPYEEGASSITYKATQFNDIGDDLATIKQAILDYGGLDAAVKWSGNQYKTTYNGAEVMATPAGTYEQSNHGVTILGWDDNYNNFPPEWGVQNPGAFLTYNPAGNGCRGNYLWVSYDDQFIKLYCYAYDMAENPAPAQHDPTYVFSTDELTINGIPYSQDINITFTGSSVENMLLVTGFFNTEGQQLFEGTDFYVECSPNGAVGTFQMKLNGMGNYEGQQIIKNINITPKDIATIDNVSIKSVNSNGTVNVIANYGDITLVEGTDYTIEYSDSQTAGKKIATIRGKGNYNGWVEREYDSSTNPPVDPPSGDNLSITISGYGTKEVGGVKYINKVAENQTVANLESKITTNGTIEIKDGTTNVTDKSSKLKTGMKVVITKGEESAEYTIVVNGDVDGNGKIDGVDLMRVARYVSGADRSLTGANLIAANVHESTKDTIDDNDALRISRYLITLEANLN